MDQVTVHGVQGFIVVGDFAPKTVVVGAVLANLGVGVTVGVDGDISAITISAHGTDNILQHLAAANQVTTTTNDWGTAEDVGGISTNAEPGSPAAEDTPGSVQGEGKEMVSKLALKGGRDEENTDPDHRITSEQTF